MALTFSLIPLLLFSQMTFALQSNELYSIDLHASYSTIKKCVGPTGHLEFSPRYTVFLIYIRPNYCLDLLKNSVNEYVYYEFPTHLDVYKKDNNTKSFKCVSNFKLINMTSEYTRLIGECRSKKLSGF